MTDPYLYMHKRSVFAGILALLLIVTTPSAFAEEIARVRSSKSLGVPVHPGYLDNNVSARIPKDATVTVVSRKGSWLEIKSPYLPKGRAAWISSRYVVKWVTDSAVSPVPIDNATFFLPPPCKSGNLRLGCWNIRNFPFDERSYTPGDGFIRESNVHDIRRVLEGLDFDLLAVAEIRDTTRFKQLLKDINRATGRTFRGVFSQSGSANEQQVGFVIDTRKLALSASGELQKVNVNGSLRPAYYVQVHSTQSKGVDFTAVAVHLKSMPQGYATRRAQVSRLLAEIKRLNDQYEEDGDLIVLGDFNSTGPPGGENDEEIKTLEREFATLDLRRLENAVPCTEYWDGPRIQDGIQVPSQIDLVFYRSLEERDPSIPLKSWLHCGLLNCREMVSDAGNEDPSYWDVSDHCPLVFEIRDQDWD